MHYKNILRVRKSKLLFMLGILLFMISCSGPHDNTGLPKKDGCDSIIYILGDKTTTIVTDSLIKNKDICYCTILANVENNEYVFTFPYGKCKDIRSNKTKNLLFRTNHFVKLREQIIPVLFMEDELFADLPKDTVHYIHDYDFATIKVNAKSEALSWHRF